MTADAPVSPGSSVSEGLCLHNYLEPRGQCHLHIEVHMLRVHYPRETDPLDKTTHWCIRSYTLRANINHTNRNERHVTTRATVEEALFG